MYSYGFWKETGSLDLLKLFNQTSVSHKMLLSLVKTKHLSTLSTACHYPQQGDVLGLQKSILTTQSTGDKCYDLEN